MVRRSAGRPGARRHARPGTRDQTGNPLSGPWRAARRAPLANLLMTAINVVHAGMWRVTLRTVKRRAPELMGKTAVWCARNGVAGAVGSILPR